MNALLDGPEEALGGKLKLIDRSCVSELLHQSSEFTKLRRGKGCITDGLQC